MVTLQLQEGRLLLRTDYQRKELAKSITGRAWSKRHQGWLCPVRPEIVTEIKALFPEVRVPEDIASACRVIEDREAEVKAAKLAGWEDAVPVAPMPIKVKAYQHQVLAFNVCMRLMGYGVEC